MADELRKQDLGATAAQDESATPHAGRYDFGDAQRLSESQFAELRQIHERFSREFAASVSALTRRTIKAIAVSCKQAESGDDRGDLSDTALLILLEVQPLDVRVALAMDSALVFTLLEALLGGRVADGGKIDRELTEIELSVLQDLHGVMSREIERAWRTAARYTFQVVEQHADHRCRQHGSLADGSLVIAVDFEVEGSRGRLTFLYPLQIGKAVEAGIQAGAISDAARRPEMVQQAVFERLKGSLLVLEGRLQGATVRLRDLMDLRAGDLLCLDIPLEQPIDVLVNGASRLTGRFTDSARKRVIRIHEVVDPARAGRK